MGKVASTADGSSVHVSWSSTVGKDLLYFIVEWKSESADVLQWKKVDKHIKGTTITGRVAYLFNLLLKQVKKINFFYIDREEGRGPKIFTQVRV